MLQNCQHLDECEATLRKFLADARLMGEANLLPEDVRILRNMFFDVLNDNVARGTALLTGRYPYCLASFLVATGLNGYKNGDYWSAVENSVGKLGPRFRGKWGNFFLNFLRQKKMPAFSLDEPQAVPAILGHGGVPDSCLDNYFSEIVLPMWSREVLGQAEAVFELSLLRENNFAWEKVRLKLCRLEEKEASIKVKIADIREKVFKLARYREKHPLVERLCSLGLPHNFAGFKESLDRELAEIKEEKGVLAARKEALKAKIKSYSKKDQKLIHHADDLVSSIKEYQKLKKTLRGFYKLQKEEAKLSQEVEAEAAYLFRGGWEPEYGDALRRVDLFELEEKMGDLEALRPGEGRDEDREPQKRPGKGRGLALLSLTLLLAGMLFPSTAATAAIALGAAGIVGWFFLVKRKNRVEKQESSHQGGYLAGLKGVRDSLQGLPLKMDVLEESPIDYLKRLAALKELYEEFCMRREHVRELKKHITGQERTIRETAVGFSGGVPVTLDDSLPVLMQSLSRARANKGEAQKAEKELDKVNESLRVRDARQEKIYKEMEGAVKNIEALGGGDYIKGMELLEEGRRDAREVAALERELCFKGPQAAEEKRKNLIRRYRGARRQLQLCRNLLAKAEKELTRCGPSFPFSVEEPVQKYLLYGGQGAEMFLSNSLKAAEDMADFGRISENNGLPERAKTFLQGWWENRFQEGIPRRAYDGRGDPYLFLSEAGEIRLGVPRQVMRLPEDSSPVTIRMGEGSFPVRCRFLGDGWVETVPSDFRLPLIAPVMHVTLAAGYQVMGSWKVQGPHLYTPYLVFDEQGCRIKLDELPRRRVRLILCQGYTLDANKAIVGERQVPGYGEGHTLYYLDLSNTDDTELIISRGEEKKLIPLQDKGSLKPKLRGGQLLAGAWLEERELYTAPPLALRLPLLSEKDTESWSLSLVKLDAPDREGQHFRLKELLYITDIQEGVAEVPLIHEKLLGRTPRGLYSLRARHARFGEELFKIAVLSDLSVDFNRSVYAPCDEISYAAVSLTLPGIHDLHVTAPVEMEKIGSDIYRLFAPVEEETIAARVETEKGSRELYLRLNVPKLRWRLEGEGLEEFSCWQQDCGELWHGDLEGAEEAWIEFSLPATCRGSLKGVLKNSRDEKVQKAEKGLFRMALKGLKPPEGGEQIFFLNLIRGKKKLLLSDVPVLKIIYSWEASDIRVLHEELPGGTVHLNIKWQEKGKADKRVRLWKFQNPWSPLVDKKLEAARVDLTIRADRKVLSPGSYLVEILEEGVSGTFPNPFRESRDTGTQKVFELKREDPYVKQWVVKRKGSPHFLLSGKLKNVNRRKVNLEAFFLGFYEGEVVLKKDRVGLVDKKKFKKKIALKNHSAHWLLLVLREGGEILNWSAHLIPGGDDLTWPLESWKSKMLGEEILHHCQVKLTCREDIPFASRLRGEKSREVIELMAGKRQCVKLDLQENGMKNLKLVKKEDGSLAFEYEKGVRCMTCGEKLAGQDIWNKSHYPKCKSLVPNIETFKARATLIWAGGNITRKLPENLRFGRELVSEIYTLYTEKNPHVVKVMEGLFKEGQNLHQAAQALFSKEKQIFQELSKWEETKD